MLLLMWKILIMNFYLSTTSESSRAVLELLLMSGLTAVPDTSQVQTHTHISTHIFPQTNIQTGFCNDPQQQLFGQLLSCDFNTINKKHATVHHMCMEDTKDNKTRTSQNKYHKHVSNPAQSLYPDDYMKPAATHMYCWLLSSLHYPYWLG